MAVKKSAKKTTTKKAATKKATAKKTTAKKTSTKKATAKKTTAKKSSSKKATRKTTKKAAETVEKAGTATEPAVAAPKTAAKKKKEAGVSSMSVNIGHVFALRPRVNTSYRPADFISAKQLLQEETYANIEEAARAVITKALELTHKGSPLQRRRGR